MTTRLLVTPLAAPAAPATAVAVAHDQISVYTDGAYEHGLCGWAFVVYEGGRVTHEESGTTPDKYHSRNVTAELQAVLQADKWLQAHHPNKKATIISDYQGVGEWILQDRTRLHEEYYDYERLGWDARSQVSIDYVEAIRPRIDLLDFDWIRGHSGVAGNIMADKLALEAIHAALKTENIMTTDNLEVVRRNKRTLLENEALIEAECQRSRRSKTIIAQCLYHIKDRELYKGKHGAGCTWEKYCIDRWGMSKSYADKLIQHGLVLHNLTNGDNCHLLGLPDCEGLTRPLSKLDPQDQSTAWSDAYKTSKGHPTSRDVQEALDRILAKIKESESWGPDTPATPESETNPEVMWFPERREPLPEPAAVQPAQEPDSIQRPVHSWEVPKKTEPTNETQPPRNLLDDTRDLLEEVGTLCLDAEVLVDQALDGNRPRFGEFVAKLRQVIRGLNLATNNLELTAQATGWEDFDLTNQPSAAEEQAQQKQNEYEAD